MAMRALKTFLAGLLAASALPAGAATLGGVDYATQYDFREFYNATDGKPFRVVLVGNPFPGLPPSQVADALLRQMQANKPRPPLTFTYDVPAEAPHPDYRLVLVFNSARDLNADSVCATGQMRARPGTPGRMDVFAIYCRNDKALSQLTAWTDASGPDDPRVGQLFREAFAELFSEALGLRPQNGAPSIR
jgi:hypothetical protein